MSDDATPTPQTPAPDTATAATSPAPVAAPPARPDAEGAVFSADYVQTLRSEAAGYRTDRNAARQELAAATARITDLEKAAGQLQELRGELDQLRTGQVLDALLGDLHAAPIARAAVRGDDVLKGIDLTTDEGKASARQALEAYLGDHPELRTAPTRSGVDWTGQGGTAPLTREAFDRMDAAERNRLFHTDRATYDQLTGR